MNPTKPQALVFLPPPSLGSSLRAPLQLEKTWMCKDPAQNRWRATQTPPQNMTTEIENRAPPLPLKPITIEPRDEDKDLQLFEEDLLSQSQSLGLFSRNQAQPFAPPWTPKQKPCQIYLPTPTPGFYEGIAVKCEPSAEKEPPSSPAVFVGACSVTPSPNVAGFPLAGMTGSLGNISFDRREFPRALTPLPVIPDLDDTYDLSNTDLAWDYSPPNLPDPAAPHPLPASPSNLAPLAFLAHPTTLANDSAEETQTPFQGGSLPCPPLQPNRPQTVFPERPDPAQTVWNLADCGRIQDSQQLVSVCCLVLDVNPVRQVQIRQGPQQGEIVNMASIIVADQSQLLFSVALWKKAATWASRLRVGDIVEISGLQIRSFKSKPVANSGYTSTLHIGHRHWANLPLQAEFKGRGKHLTDQLLQRLVLWARESQLFPLSDVHPSGEGPLQEEGKENRGEQDQDPLSPARLSRSLHQFANNSVVTVNATILAVLRPNPLNPGWSRTTVHLVDRAQHTAELVLAPRESALLQFVGSHQKVSCLFEHFHLSFEDTPVLRSTATSKISRLPPESRTIKASAPRRFSTLKDMLQAKFTGLAAVSGVVVEIRLGSMRHRRGQEISVSSTDFRSCSVVRCTTCQKTVMLTPRKIEQGEWFCGKCGFVTPMTWSWSSLVLILQDESGLHQAEVHVDPGKTTELFPTFTTEWPNTPQAKRARHSRNLCFDSPVLCPLPTPMRAVDQAIQDSSFELTQEAQEPVFSPYFPRTTSARGSARRRPFPDSPGSSLLRHLKKDLEQLLGRRFDFSLHCHTQLDDHSFIQAQKFTLLNLGPQSPKKV